MIVAPIRCPLLSGVVAGAGGSEGEAQNDRVAAGVVVAAVEHHAVRRRFTPQVQCVVAGTAVEMDGGLRKLGAVEIARDGERVVAAVAGEIDVFDARDQRSRAVDLDLEAGVVNVAVADGKGVVIGIAVDVEPVDVGATVDGVAAVAGVVDDGVVAGVAGNGVIATAAGDGVGAAIAMDDVGGRAADQNVGGRAAGSVGDGAERIDADDMTAAGHQVGGTVTVDGRVPEIASLAPD